MPRHRNRHDPVFVDQTGRRRRAITLVGAGGALTLTVAVAVLAAGFVGAGPGRLPGLPELLHGPAPTPSVQQPSTPTATASGQPGVVRPTAGPSAPATAAPTPTRQGNRPSSAPSHPAPTKKRP
jgi:hypothetical protein